MPTDAAPHSFAIDCPTTSIQLDASGRGSVVLTITNTSAASIDGRLRLAGAGTSPATEAWLTISDPAESRYKPNESKRFSVAISVPPSQADGTFLFRAETYAVANPNEDFTSGPEISITVKRAAAPVHKHVPLWIPIAAVVAVLVIAGVIIAVVRSHQATAAESSEASEPSAHAKGEAPSSGPAKATLPEHPSAKQEQERPETAKSEQEEPAAKQGTIQVHPGNLIDLAAAKELPASERGEADLAYAAVVGGHLLECEGAARFALTQGVSEADCRTALLHASLTSIRLDQLKPAELLACRTKQGDIWVIRILAEPNGPAALLELHYQLVVAAKSK